MGGAMKILLEAGPGEVRAAAVADDNQLFAGLTDFALWRPGAPDGLGDLWRGRVRKRVASMAGAFVAFGDGLDGFLPDSSGAAGLTEGDAVVARVERSPVGDKGPRLSAQLSPAERAAADADVSSGLLRRGPNPIERIAALHKSAQIFAGSPRLIAALRPALGERVVSGPAHFPDDVAEAVAAFGEPVVETPGGGRLCFTPTPALVAIDMDSGTMTGERGGSAAAWFAAMLPALARQIRLRDLSGAIVVDPAGMSRKARQTLAPAVTAALATDPRRPRVLGVTALGLIEIMRTRVGPPLHERLAGPHAAGLAGLRAMLAAARPAEAPPALRAAPAIIAALEADAAALDDMRAATGRAPILRADPDLPPTHWRLVLG
jgi:Ribonuclease G/E